MSKAKPLTRIHKRAELIDSSIPKSGAKTHKRYIRENSPRIVHGEAGMKTDNIRGRYSELNPDELEQIQTDRELRTRSFGRSSKIAARSRIPKKA